MGLDSYASRSPGDVVLTEEDTAAFANADLELCGGLYSGDGGASFRGKVYASLILEVAEEDIYEEWLPPAAVGRISDALGKRTPDELASLYEETAGRWSTTPKQMADLQRFFAICAERGLGLIGWS
jgi:hypothetical protein